MSFKPFDSRIFEAVKELKQLKRKISMKSPHGRIDFVAAVFSNNLYNDVITHELFDLGISGRDYDTCFEMCDKEIVIHGVVERAIENPSIRYAIEKTGVNVWPRWKSIYESLNTQQDMFSTGS